MPYLFVHFREKTTPDGEQVYFAVSRDGFRWEAVNGGAPVLWSYLGEKGVRDCAIVYCPEDRRYRILATDLSLAYRSRQEYPFDWPKISRTGSKCLSMWESEDLVNWSEQRLLPLGTEEFGCLWAPDVLYDPKQGEYMIHWSSAHSSLDNMGIFFSKTRDFQTFTRPGLLYRKEDAGVIDSAIYEEDGAYYLFAKSDFAPARNILLRAETPEGPYVRVREFDRSMEAVEEGLYEGAAATRLEDGRWCLFLDYYGDAGPKQGYVPFVADSLASGKFRRAEEDFSFPYGIKHGTIISISTEEFDRICKHDWSDKGWK